MRERKTRQPASSCSYAAETPPLRRSKRRRPRRAHLSAFLQPNNNLETTRLYEIRSFSSFPPSKRDATHDSGPIGGAGSRTGAHEVRRLPPSPSSFRRRVDLARSFRVLSDLLEASLTCSITSKTCADDPPSPSPRSPPFRLPLIVDLHPLDVDVVPSSPLSARTCQVCTARRCCTRT